MPQAGKTYSPLKRDLPLLNIDGSIKLSDILAVTRKRRRNRRAAAARAGSTPLSRFDAVRSDIEGIREKVAADRAFWSVENKPTAVYEKRQVQAWGRSYDDMVRVDDRDAA